MNIVDYNTALAACGSNPTTVLEPDVLLVKNRYSVCLTYSNMPLVLYRSDGRIIIYEDAECGTVTAKNKLNKYTPDCITVVQVDFKFRVKFYDIDLPFDGTFFFNPLLKKVYHEKIGL